MDRLHCSCYGTFRGTAPPHAAFSVLFFCCLFLIADQHLLARQEHYYFYKGRDYGSESLINPLSLVLHGGYGIMQVENRSNAPLDVDYRAGLSNVWKNMSHPFRAINAYGWDDFLSSEIVPMSFSKRQANYWPNYTQHLLGGGMSYRMMTDWFSYHGYRYPRIFSLTTIGIYHLLNEVVENGSFDGYTVDPIADLYVFDPLSIMLFSFDSVAAFFSNSLNMTDWSYQIAYNPWDKTIQNMGQNFVLKYRIPQTKNWSLFYHYGTHGELGFSYKKNSGESYSFGAGLTAKELVGVPDKDSNHIRSLTANLALTAGIFYDRDGSLLASLIYAGKKDNMYRLNIYPGLISLKTFTPGLFLLVSRQREVIIGTHVRYVPMAIAKKL